jgi:hypothetical protein
MTPDGQAGGGVDPRAMLSQLSQAGVDDAHARAVADLLSHDFILGNIHRAGLDYLRLLSQNVALYAQEAFPPADSIVAEEVAAGLLEDPDKADLKPMSPTDRDRMETALLAFFIRTTRSYDGWQQDKLSEQIVTRRIEEIEDEAESDSKTVIGRLFN